MPSLVVLQSVHNDIFDFLVDEAARFFVHFVTHYSSAFSLRFYKRQSAVFALSGYALLYSAKPTCAMLRVFLSDNHRQPFLLAREWACNLKLPPIRT